MIFRLPFTHTSTVILHFLGPPVSVKRIRSHTCALVKSAVKEAGLSSTSVLIIIQFKNQNKTLIITQSFLLPCSCSQPPVSLTKHLQPCPGGPGSPPADQAGHALRPPSRDHGAPILEPLQAGPSLVSTFHAATMPWHCLSS